MDPLLPKTADESKVNEATPILQEEVFEYDDELYAIGGAVGGSTSVCGSAEANGEACGFTETSGVLIDSTEEIEDTSGRTDDAICEAQSDKDEIVKILFTIWLQCPPRSLNEIANEDYQFFSPRAQQVISATWRQIRSKRETLPEPEEIVEGLVASVVNRIYPRHVVLPAIVEAAVKRAIAGRLEQKVADGWTQILEAIEKEDKERARKRREKRRKRREQLRKDEEVAEVLRFYAAFAQLNFHVPINCRTFTNFLCMFFSVYIFQIPIHSLLLCWPISIAVMGGLYMKQCPMSYLMPYVMIALGIVGVVALLMRLSFVIYEIISDYEIRSSWPWIVLKVIEFTFLDFFIIQLYYFYSETPSFTPGSLKYCNKTLYNFVHWINYVSFAFVSAWIFVYLTKGILWVLNRRNRCIYRC